jgi:hypothetical protein
VDDAAFPWRVLVELPDWDESGASLDDLRGALHGEEGVDDVLEIRERLHAQVPPAVRVAVTAGRSPADAAEVAERVVRAALERLGQPGSPAASIISTDSQPPALDV